MIRFGNVGVFIQEKVWLEPYFSRINHSNILQHSHSSYLSAYEDGTECSETSEYKIQKPGNYPEKSTRHSENTAKVSNQVCNESKRTKLMRLILNLL
jgi:hypothetical protein